VVIAGVLGLLHESWPRHSHAFWIDVHALTGLLLWIVVLGRLCVRFTPPASPLPTLARCLRRLLYALLMVTPVFGMLTLACKDRAACESTEDIHAYLAYAAFVLAIFQMLATLWHRFIRRDDLLRRTWWNS
jgi:cytochrome b561